MRRLVVIVVMGAISLLVAACTKGGGDGAGGHGAERQVQRDKASNPPKEGIIEVVKAIKLANYTTSTIGNAFDTYRYFDKREWSETRTSNGKIYVGFWGWFNAGTLDAASKKNGIAARGVEAKFVIYPDGIFDLVMISKIEAMTDGKKFAYPLEDKKRIMDAIYASKEISF